MVTVRLSTLGVPNHAPGLSNVTSLFTIIDEHSNLEMDILVRIIYIVTRYLWMWVVILGIPGNLLSLAISLQKDNRRISTCLYVAALASADTTKLVVAAWAYTVMFWTRQLSVLHVR
jgi:hypothetical protein